MRADKSLSPFEIRLYRHYRVVHGIRIALAFLLTFLLVRLLNIPEGTWPLITLVVIMGPISFWGNVVPRAFERIGGTILGSVLGLIALRLELFSLPLMLIWCAVAMFLCGWLALGKRPYQDVHNKKNITTTNTGGCMPLHNLTRFPRLEFIGAPTPLEYLPRFSDYLGRDIFIKRDDVTPMAMGGNKLRKLEFLAADALREGADTLITAGAIQSNHVRQTAAVAAKLGLHCVALLENPIGTTAENYLTNGNRLLLDLFNTQIEMCDALTDPNAQLQELATRIEAQGFRPYVIPVGGSNALGAMGYVESALEIAQQCEGAVSLSSVVVASGSAGTHAGLAVGLEQLMPDVELIGVTVSRSVADQKPKVVTLQQDIARELELTASADILLWDDYYAPGYGTPNEEGMEAVKLLARLEGILLDPVYTGKAMAGLIDGISQKRFKDEGPILFIHTGGAPALFAYHPHV